MNNNENLPEVNDDNNKENLPEIKVNDDVALNYSLNLAQYTVYKRYLTDLSTYPIAEPNEAFLTQSSENCACFCKLKKLVYKPGEDILQKLSTVYYASMSLGCSLIIMLDVKSANSPVDIYIGVRNDGDNKDALDTSFNLLKKEMKSNFPGSELAEIGSKVDMPELINDIFSEEVVKSISSVSCVAALRDKSKTEDKSFIQGIERFIEAMHGEPYTAMFIAEPISNTELSSIRDGYEELFTSLSTFSKSSWSYGVNESHAVMHGISESISDSVTQSISKTQSHTTTKGGSIGVNIGVSKGQSSTEPSTLSRVGNFLSASGPVLSAVLSIVGMECPPVALLAPVIGKGAQAAGTLMQGGSVSESIGGMFGLNAGVHKDNADTEGTTEQDGSSHTIQKGTQSADTDTKGSSKTIQIEKTNKHIDEILNKIEAQLKRTAECEDYGAYNCAAYFISSDSSTCQLAANTYRALMIGEGSSVESSAVNTWKEKNSVNTIKEYLRRFSHPIFGMPYGNLSDMTLQFVEMSAGTVISGLELPLHLGMPTKSVYGVPVIKHAEFGRSVNSLKNDNDSERIKMGHIYHMGNLEASKVLLDKSSLTSHTFITGSTGSGKSNVVYKLLSELISLESDEKDDKKVTFLVVEPAKGEYKNSIRRKDIRVYGLLPGKQDSELLKTNPFSFPEEIHILEHLDRITELFNVCWPMYAAMPALLKEAIQKAYEKCGWNIETSLNRFGYQLFPDFSDVEYEIRSIIEKSDYSSDNKSDYIGSLVTRIHSMTNGIFGMVFSGKELSNEVLFDNNAIVDLSRSGSSETKSLIMGILVLKLQEYRMSQAVDTNEALKHITVLEEAHHLLKRTVSNQSEGGNNLQEKAVEMLTNAIAEMRTYGEGFVIADQAPGLLDPSVIRNTNTKIIMRLPNYSDCELVGKAVGLDEYQITEMASLEQGVAIIRQNDWLEPVLCKIDKYDIKQYMITDHDSENMISNDYTDKSKVEEILFQYIIGRKSINDIITIKDEIMNSDLKTCIKCSILNMIESDTDYRNKYFSRFVYDFLEAGETINRVLDNVAYDNDIIFDILVSLKYPVIRCGYKVRLSLLICILKEYSIRGGKNKKLFDKFINDMES